MPHLRRYGPIKLRDGTEMAIFCVLYFSASHVQHISDMHSKFALRSHHVWKYGIVIQSPTANIRRGKKTEDRKKDRNHRAKI